MPNFRLLLEYDGAPFEGWQVQARDALTVQGSLEAALEKITGQSVVVTGSGRTDAGVHAEGQVASFALETELAPERLLRAMNGVLPREIAVRELSVAPAEFDARRSARRKLYRYRVWNAGERSPLRAARSHHVPQPLDVRAMREAAVQLVGEHDFGCFRAAGSDVKTSVRTLHRVALEGEAGGELSLEVEGSGFLRYMVRNIAGTLLEVGLGKRASGSLGELIASRDRHLAGPTAPAHGLTLVWVEYEGETSA